MSRRGSPPAGRDDRAGDPAGWGEWTRAVHLPEPPPVPQASLSVPVHRASAYAFSSAREFAEVMADPALGYSYGRVDNPTADAFAAAVAHLEGSGLPGGVAGQAFASGMAAVHGALLPFLRAGAKLVAPASMYGTTLALFRSVLGRYGVRVELVDIADAAAVASAVREGPGPPAAVLYAETLVNPTMTVADLPALAGIASAAGALLVVDSTFASPAVCRPLEHGADAVVHSATKYLGGHSDATGGVVVARPELAARIRADRVLTGATLAPDEAFLLRRGLETLPLRVDRACASARILAHAAADHPRVRSVLHPSLRSHPGHLLAQRLFDRGLDGETRCGACLTVIPHGGRDAGMAFCDRLRLAAVASSLGGTRTKVSHAASTSHRELDAGQLAAAGIDPGAVRFSVGLEDPGDIVADVLGALDGLP